MNRPFFAFNNQEIGLLYQVLDDEEQRFNDLSESFKQHGCYSEHVANRLNLLTKLKTLAMKELTNPLE